MKKTALALLLPLLVILPSCGGIPGLPDGDGDGIPDIIDPCPDNPDPACMPDPGGSGPYNCENPPALAGLVLVKNPIPDRYIVVLKPASAAVLQSPSSSFKGLTSVQTLGLVGGFSAKMDVRNLLATLADPRVKYVQQEGRVETFDVKSWGLDRIDQRTLPLDGVFDPGTGGEGVHVYINDTGVAPHPEFGDRLSEDCFSTIIFAGCSDDPQGTGHGKHVAGTAAGSSFGVCRDCTIHSVRFLDKNGSGSDTDAIRSLEWIAAHDPGPAALGKVVNASWGGGASPVLDDAVCKVIASGATFVAAAGNSNADAAGSSPARVVQAITIGASDDKDREASFSNHGEVVDLYAPGVGIRSIGGSKNGTSMSAPHATGIAALTLARAPNSTPAEVAEKIITRSTKDVLSGLGPGSPNRLAYAREEATP